MGIRVDRLRLRAHQTGAGLRCRVERWEPSTISRLGIWKPTQPLLEAAKALELTQGRRVEVVR